MAKKRKAAKATRKATKRSVTVADLPPKETVRAGMSAAARRQRTSQCLRRRDTAPGRESQEDEERETQGGQEEGRVGQEPRGAGQGQDEACHGAGDPARPLSGDARCTPVG